MSATTEYLPERVTTPARVVPDLQGSLAHRQPTLDAKVIESVLLGGDLSKLTPDQRVSYYNRVCETLGINPLTQPFKYLTLNGRLTLYATKDATEQLRKLHGVSITELSSQQVGDVFVVTAKAEDRTHRTDAATGAVSVANLKGESLANALMKAETKAKRRATLSICGLGMLDETEAEPLASREPQYSVEAERRVEQLPDGTVQILRVVPKRHKQAEWCEVTFVDGNGEEQTLPTPADGTGIGAGLFEQLAQESAPVLITTRVTPRSKKTVIDSVQRYSAGQVAENAAIDAEIAAGDGAF